MKRVVTIPDISCFGKCSITVALPLISAMGIECAIIPTSVLSTHTGGFYGFTFRDFNHDALYDAFRRALTLFATDRKAWGEVMRRGMSSDLSWKKGAEAYLALYRDLTGIQQ